MKPNHPSARIINDGMGGFVLIGIYDPDRIAIKCLKQEINLSKEFSSQIAKVHKFRAIGDLIKACEQIHFDCIIISSKSEVAHSSLYLREIFTQYLFVEHSDQFLFFIKDPFCAEIIQPLCEKIFINSSNQYAKERNKLYEILKEHGFTEEDILYAESRNHRVFLYFSGKSTFEEESSYLYARLDDIEKILQRTKFLRVHKSYLVNMRYIMECTNYKVLLANGIVLPSSRKYFSRAKEKYKQLQIVT